MKTKNKKLFVLLMLPAVIAMLVLPLCSFTTSNSYPWDFTIYESNTQCDLTYRYYRGDDYGYYYGTIPSANRVLISNDALATNNITSIRDSIEFIADDLLMIGTKSIDIRAFSNNTLGSSLDKISGYSSLYLGLTYVSDDYTTSALDGVFYFRNYKAYDDIRLNIFDINNEAIDYANNTVNCTATVYVSNFDYDDQAFEYDHYILNEPLDYYIGDNVVYAYDIVLNDIVDAVMDYYNIILDDNVVVNNVELMLTYPTESGADFGFGAVRLKSFISPVDYASGWSLDVEEYIQRIYNDLFNSAYSEGYFEGNSAGQETGYSEGYLQGFEAGKIKGQSDLKNAWGSLDDFLTSTVGSFFSFELWDGFSLGGVMAIIVGALLFVAFLKVFAGG